MKSLISSKNKKSQSELITTVLLILVAIAAVVLVSTFVINLVRDYLKPTDCFKTTGQLSIVTEESNTYYSPSQGLSISINRGEMEYNLTGINVVYGNLYLSKKVKIPTDTSVQMYSSGGALSNNVTVPGTHETKTYLINTSAFAGAVTKVSIAPILQSSGDCKEVDSKEISTIT